jgi:hypothetical protein
MDSNLQTIITRINNAFLELESFIDEPLNEYKYFDFDLHFTNLFSYLKRYKKNITPNISGLIMDYWFLASDIIPAINCEGFYLNDYLCKKNDVFVKVCNELDVIIKNRQDDFFQFEDLSNGLDDEIDDSSILTISEIYTRFSNNESRTKQQKKTSYEWQNEPEKELPELYRLMIDKYKLIAPDTTIEQFKAVFTGQPIESIKPIKWQANASELLYFDEAIKKKVNGVWHIYQRMTACFVEPDGKLFTANWKQIKTEINLKLKQKKQTAIDELVSNF